MHSTPPSPSSITELLLELLARQQTLVAELAGLGERQTALIAGAETDALLELLTQRQRIIHHFTESQHELGTLMTRLEPDLGEISEAVRERIQTLIGEIGAALTEVMTRDESDQRDLESARGSAREQLGAVDTARQARQAYLGSQVVNNRFADRKG